MMAPAPTMIRLPSKERVSRARGTPRADQDAGIKVEGMAGIQRFHWSTPVSRTKWPAMRFGRPMTPSRHQAMRSPTPRAPKRARAFWMASPPSAYIPLSTSEVANPVGNFRSSTLIIWRFMGMAMQRPRKRMDATHRASCQVGRVRPEIMVRAGTALERPAEAMKAHAAAMVMRMLFSRIPMSRLTRKGRVTLRALKMAKAMMAAVMVTPRLQPALNPT